ncbi:hypothetical protein GGC47_003910 [Bosea sp. OAE752]|uniref:YcxB family protein n=1 Tax=unclassified Bosea (in: a-proteobacteria) TaxID=2653178 RepID=UPI00114EB3B2
MRREAIVEIGEADLVAAQRLILRDSLRNPSGRWKQLLLWIVAVVLFTLSLNGELPGGLAGAALLCAFGTFLLVFGLPVLIVLLLGPRAARRNFRVVPAFQAPLHYRWDEEGLTSETTSGHAMNRWPIYRRWLENERLLLLWPHPATYQILPKRALEPEQVEDLRRFLSQQAGT